ncbi:putative ABC transporter [Methanocella paludicola SANAE]|uniref:ABC transporter n=2 Tax=Methanocella TaxID=570266 RepID=D1YVS0_METPS|nr:putative ABC transporter [Methanocella paludicola SANAE]
MGGFYAIMNKELVSVMKEKTIVLAILIQLLIAAFSSVILVGLMSFYDPNSIAENTNIHFSVGVSGDSDGVFSSYLRDSNFVVSAYATEEEAKEAMRSGIIDAVIAIPASEGVVDMQLYMPQSDTSATVFTMLIKEPLKKYENYLREKNGIHVMYTGMSGRQSTTFEFLYSFIVPLLMLFPAFIAGSMIIDSISEEVENKTLDTLLSAPVSLNAVLFGKVAATLFLAAVQCVLWLVLLSLNRLYVQSPLEVLLLALIITAFVTFGSGIISLYFKDRERSQFAYSMLLLAAAGASLFFDPSPLSLMARLAMGDLHVGLSDVAIFVVPLIVLIGAFTLASRRLIAMKA